MSRLSVNGLAAVFGFALAVLTIASWTARQDDFVHTEHAGLFPTCQGCHEPAGPEMSIPDEASCTDCHDGKTEEEVDWQPSPRRSSNLVFDHESVIAAELEELGVADRPCESCHTPENADRMEVERAVVDNCMTCHLEGAEHLTEAPCAECHVPIAEATDFSVEELAAFPVPTGHEVDDFILSHTPLEGDVSDCSICHARESCSSCHVNAPKVAEIQALAGDPRAAAVAARKEIVYPRPPSHLDVEWLEGHGAEVTKVGIAACETCHAQDSCTSCHLGDLPPVVLELTPAIASARLTAEVILAQERGPGVKIGRTPPPSHTPAYIEMHRAAGASNTAQCQFCHTQEMCTSCHTGSEATLVAGDFPDRFHVRNYMQQHSADAFAQKIECASCHNTYVFCQDCHSAQGLGAGSGRIDTGFHNKNANFVFGHGQAARQGLESCASCHAQSDCTACHSANGGRRVNPHGPGFDPERLAEKNGQMCLFCHFSSILDR